MRILKQTLNRWWNGASDVDGIDDHRFVKRVFCEKLRRTGQPERKTALNSTKKKDDYDDDEKTESLAFVCLICDDIIGNI